MKAVLVTGAAGLIGSHLCEAFAQAGWKVRALDRPGSDASVAEAAGLTCTVGSNLELGVASAAMAHLATACPGIGAEEFPCDILGPIAYENDLLAEPLDVRQGSVKAPEGPGLGISLDEDAVARYRVV